MSQPNQSAGWVWIGTYTARGSEGIYTCRLDSATGALEVVGVTTGISNPSFLALHPNGRTLYAVSEARMGNERSDGALCAYALAGGGAPTGELAFLNRQPSQGVGPCHVSVEHGGRYALVANYASGSVAIFPILPDGSLGPASDAVQHSGRSVNPERQEGPHAHSINVDPGNRYALVPDLGLDRVMIYRLDLERGRLLPGTQPWLAMTPGSGPRHLAFHLNGRYAYVINELGNSVTVLAWDSEQGALRRLQEISTLPAGWVGTSYCADIHMTASGRCLYGSNRGHDSIASYAVDPGTGLLSAPAYTPTGGQFPRNFGLDPSGQWLVAANQDSDTLVTFRVQPETGALLPTGQVARVSMPVCVRFLGGRA